MVFRLPDPRPRSQWASYGGREYLGGGGGVVRTVSRDSLPQDFEEEDVVVDVGGMGRPVAYRIPLEDEEYDEDDYDTDTDMESDDEIQREESYTKHLTHKYKSLSYEDHHKTMDDACCFCLEEFTCVDAVTTDCGHSFCATCFDSYKKQTKCPCCRHSVVSLTRYCLTAKKDKESLCARDGHRPLETP